MNKILLMAFAAGIILTGCSSSFCQTEKNEINKLNSEINLLNEDKTGFNEKIDQYKAEITKLNGEIEQYKTETDKQSKIDECLAKAESDCSGIKADHTNAVAKCPNQNSTCMTEVANIWSNYKSKCLNNSLRDECLARYK